jgi:hypothetical protein
MTRVGRVRRGGRPGSARDAETAAGHWHSYLRRTTGHHGVILSDGPKYPIYRADIRSMSVMVLIDRKQGSDPRDPPLEVRRKRQRPKGRVVCLLPGEKIAEVPNDRMRYCRGAGG